MSQASSSVPTSCPGFIYILFTHLLCLADPSGPTMQACANCPSSVNMAIKSAPLFLALALLALIAINGYLVNAVPEAGLMTEGSAARQLTDNHEGGGGGRPGDGDGGGWPTGGEGSGSRGVGGGGGGYFRNGREEFECEWKGRKYTSWYRNKDSYFYYFHPEGYYCCRKGWSKRRC